jgi:hypothetical protein
VARLLATALLAAAVVAAWLAWIAYEVLCEEGCTGRPWPLVAQLIVACACLPLAALSALTTARRGVRGARRLLVGTAIGYALWALLLIAATAG